MEIKKWIADGDYSFSQQGMETTEELLQAAGRLLDKAYAHDIVGEIIFEGEDGEHYVGCVEFVISKADPDYVRDYLDYLETEAEEKE